jgi:hypothetical protein
LPAYSLKNQNEFENETIANLSPLEYMDRHIPEFENI